MTETFLNKIFEVKKKRVDVQKQIVEIAGLRERALAVRAASMPYRLSQAFQNAGKINVIAEIKRASPSKGIINDNIDVEALAKSYQRGGACAISILTEEDFFKGSLADLRKVRQAVDVPLLRKDFVFDEFQIYEAAEAGADAVLLIAAMLEDSALNKLYRAADEIGLDILVEVHTLEELERAKNLGAKIIGINNRDLQTFNVSLDVSRTLVKQAPKDALIIAESGLQTREEILELSNAGFSGFLIGETLMKSVDVEEELRKLTTEHTESAEAC